MIAKIDQLPEEPTTEQVLGYLGISEKALRNLRRDGYIEPIRNVVLTRNRVNHYKRADVERLKKYGRGVPPPYREARAS